MRSKVNVSGKAKHYGVWILQLLLGALFIFAGGMKLVIAPEVLASMGSPNQIQLPGALIQFIGVVEVLGALGLVLPGMVGIRRELTSMAASGLVIIMAGATVLTLASGEIGSAVIPFVIGLLLFYVARFRKIRPSAKPVTLTASVA
jgi:uncharacterized membrane protein YphA (DoxX/SURF4 family)